MSNATFIAVEDSISVDGKPIPKGVYHTSIFKFIGCDKTECHVATAGIAFEVSKKDHPKTYQNFSQFSESPNVFKATGTND